MSKINRHKLTDAIIKKSAQAASEIKPVLQPAYISELNRRLKTLSGTNAAYLKKKPNKPWWTYYMYPRSAGWKKFARRLESPREMLQLREELPSEKIRSPIFSHESDRNEDNTNLSPDMDVVKITTIVEAIRRKGQRRTQASEGTRNIHGIIEKKRAKRSSDETGNGWTTTSNKNSSFARKGKAFISNKRSPYPNQYRGRKKILPTRNRATDLKATNNNPIPSTVFYKRIWEYINGTRPHSDIISGYSIPAKDNTTCNDKDQIGTSQSQKNEHQTVNSDVKQEKEFYKRIWDIINATRSTYGNARVRSKRNASVPKDNIPAAASSQSKCAQEKETNEKDNKRARTTNGPGKPHITTDTIYSRDIPTPGPYVSAFWTVANRTQWQPESIQVSPIVKLNDELILSSRTNTASASEVADLNKPSYEARSNIEYPSIPDNSTEHAEEAPRNESPEITEPGPPYPYERENFTASSFSPSERLIDNTSRKDDRTNHKEHHQSTDNPIYDPSKIPYVDVPDYSDQREDSLEDKSNQSSTANKYKEYYNSDHVDPERSYNAEEFSSKSPSAEIELISDIQVKNEKQEKSSVNANISHCAENKDSAVCTDDDKHDNEDTKSRDNSEGDTSDDDTHRPAEDSAEPASSAENKNSTADFVPVRFDVNEYSNPFNLDDFMKKDPTYKDTGTVSDKEDTGYDDKEDTGYDDKEDTGYDDKEDTGYDDKEDTRYDDKENSDRNNNESEEMERYTYPKEELYDYYTKNENFHDDFGIVFGDKDAKKDTEKETKDSEVIDEDYYPYRDKNFFKHIFEDDRDEESSDIIETEDEFLTRYFTKDVLDHLRENSTAEEDRKREESRNRESIRKTLSGILDKKDRFSRLNENLDKMIEDGEAVPIKYNNFWSLEYESPRKRDKEEEESSEI